MQEKILPKKNLDNLIRILQAEGYLVIGPQIVDDAIQYQALQEASQLPIGFSDEQKPGSYTITPSRRQNSYFAWANGPQALKPLLFKPKEILWAAEKDDSGAIHFQPHTPKPKPTAVLGIRACDLAALALQDKHFLQKEYVDPYYQQRRDALLLIAVNCSHPSANCFCVSTGDGPYVKQDCDIVLTELDDVFFVTSGSKKGGALIAQMQLQDATTEFDAACAEQEQQAIHAQTKTLPSMNVPSLLREKNTHPYWQKIAETCLSCGNCTAVCPTCFCHAEKDEPALHGKNSQHIRVWDSCFSQEHGYIHGMQIRVETSQQYRQWLTHKFSHWLEQYGRSGCVGCGRCISWCPVGIDVTESVSRLCHE